MLRMLKAQATVKRSLHVVSVLGELDLLTSAVK